MFTARQAGVARIEKVKLAPGNVYKINVDYAFTIAGDGSQASVRLINKDKFKADRTMVILVN